ncbi:MAG: SCP2 sterol-binding domain-containing protein [Burkholderiales bacterium]|nr:SCP2 sterol-binding domain-containing protein [Burkholderiales bacterium]
MTSAAVWTRLIEPVGRLVGRLPQFPHSTALAAALNVGIRARLGGEVPPELRGKVVRIVVRDAGLRFTLLYDGSVFRPRFSHDAADVTISASLHDFGLLATRKEDPDSLFFARRLLIEGDTELGLTVKNALDALDTSRLSDVLDRLASLRRPREATNADGSSGNRARFLP